jgi:hypothetical protein
MHAIRCREGAGPIAASVVQQRVDSLSTKMRALDLPLLSGFVGAQHECALHGTDEKKRLLPL